MKNSRNLFFIFVNESRINFQIICVSTIMIKIIHTEILRRNDSFCELYDGETLVIKLKDIYSIDNDINIKIKLGFEFDNLAMKKFLTK